MNKNIVLAFALAIGFMALWYGLIVPHYFPQPPSPSPSQPVNPPAAPAPEAPQPAAPAAPQAAVPTESSAPQAAAAAAEVPVAEKYRQENINANDEKTLSTDAFTVVFTPQSGSVRSVTLNNPKFKNFSRTGQLVLLRDFAAGEFPTQITDIGGQNVKDRLYAVESVTNDPGGTKQIVYGTELPSGLRITKTYTLYPGKYGIGLEVKVENLSPSARSVGYGIRGPAGVPSEDYSEVDVMGALATVSPSEGLQGKMDLTEAPAAKLLALLGKGDLAPAPGRRAIYAGAVSRYFAAVMKPDVSVPLSGARAYAVADSDRAKMLLGDKDPVKTAEGYPEKERQSYLGAVFFTAGARFTTAETDLAAAGSSGSSLAHSYLIYCGPREKSALSAFDTATMSTGFGRLLDYGWFEPLVKIILWILWIFHKAIPNWGVAIILMTLLVRAFMHPLTRKSQISMSKMQKLQPQIKKLQEKYKNDKQKLGAEQMKLMKEAGANPLGGCLPMLIQLPIFIALYRALMVSIDLRQAPFALWMHDLAQPDMLAILPFTLPIVGNSFNLLPILMAVAMALQSLWQQKPATPEMAQQQKMMTILMPILMGVLLYRLASGLNLYIFTSTVAGIIEQWLIKRHLAAQEAQ